MAAWDKNYFNGTVAKKKKIMRCTSVHHYSAWKPSFLLISSIVLVLTISLSLPSLSHWVMLMFDEAYGWQSSPFNCSIVIWWGHACCVRCCGGLMWCHPTHSLPFSASLPNTSFLHPLSVSHPPPSFTLFATQHQHPHTNPFAP